jgi:hypothetical protein
MPIGSIHIESGCRQARVSGCRFTRSSSSSATARISPLIGKLGTYVQRAPGIDWASIVYTRLECSSSTPADKTPPYELRCLDPPGRARGSFRSDECHRLEPELLASVYRLARRSRAEKANQ